MAIFGYFHKNAINFQKYTFFKIQDVSWPYYEYNTHGIMVRNYTLNGTDIDPNIEMINSYIKVWSNTYATIALPVKMGSISKNGQNLIKIVKNWKNGHFWRFSVKFDKIFKNPSSRCLWVYFYSILTINVVF